MPKTRRSQLIHSPATWHQGLTTMLFFFFYRHIHACKNTIAKQNTFTLCLIFALWSNLVAELLERNNLYSTGSSADTNTHKNKEPLVLHKKKKKKKVPISTVRHQNSILVNIKLAQSKLAHIKERIKRNPKRAHRVLQLHNQAFCQLCRTPLADSRVCKGVSHTTKSPPKKKKRKWERRTMWCHFWSSSW